MIAEFKSMNIVTQPIRFEFKSEDGLDSIGTHHNGRNSSVILQMVKLLEQYAVHGIVKNSRPVDGFFCNTVDS